MEQETKLLQSCSPVSELMFKVRIGPSAEPEKCATFISICASVISTDSQVNSRVKCFLRLARQIQPHLFIPTKYVTMSSNSRDTPPQSSHVDSTRTLLISYNVSHANMSPRSTSCYFCFTNRCFSALFSIQSKHRIACAEQDTFRRQQ